MNVSEILSYDKIEDEVLGIALIVTDPHLSRDVESACVDCSAAVC